MIEAKRCQLIYRDGSMGLRPFDFKSMPHTLTVITGESGAGKTTFLNLLMGILRPTEGMLRVLGRDMRHLSEKELRALRREIGPVFQSFRMIPGHTALETVRMGVRFLEGASEAHVMGALERVGLKEKIYHSVETLSWGERQRVSIARAVARQPRLILADEPTGNLDADTAIAILELLASCVSSETSVVLTTHAPHLLNQMSDIGHIRQFQSVKITHGLLSLERVSKGDAVYEK